MKERKAIIGAFEDLEEENLVFTNVQEVKFLKLMITSE